MGVLRLLVLVCLLCTIVSIDSLQYVFLWESSLLLCPVFQTGVFWIRCKLLGMSWMTSVLLVNHRHWYVWGTAWWMHAVAWNYHLHQCRPCTWESQVCLVQSQPASGQSQRLWLLSPSEHWLTQLSQDQHCSSYIWWLVVPCEIVSAEQLRQHQLHRNGGLHQFQLHWPSSVFLLCLGVWVPCPWVLSVRIGTWASNVLNFPHPWQWLFLAGHDDLPGGWDFVHTVCWRFSPLAKFVLPLYGIDCFLFHQSHGLKVVWDGNVCAAHFKHLRCCCFQI